MLPELLQIGVVCRPHGLRGELRVRLHNQTSEALEDLKRLWLGADVEPAPPGAGVGALREWRIRAVKRQPDGFYLLALEGVTDRTGAEGLRAQRLYAHRDDLPKLAEDEVYEADLVGCRVVDRAGQEVGVATEVESHGGQSLLVVRRPGRRLDALVPLVPEIVCSVDLEQRIVEIDPPEGLLELDEDATDREAGSATEEARASEEGA